MKQILLLAFILFTMFKVNAQSQCATDEYDTFLKRTNPTYAAERQKMEQQIYSILKNKQNNPNARIMQYDCQPSGVFTIPVVVHVIHKGEAIGTGFNISDAQIQGAIQGMNERWRRVTGDGVDLEIQFALAVRDTNNNATNGITRYDGRVFTNYTANGVYSAGFPGASTVSIMDSTVWDRSKYINIWVVDLRDACGFSSLGAPNTLFVQDGCMSNSTTLGHEMGHTFGLHHTFAGDGSGGGLDPSTQCPSNNDCLLEGDWVCDTPPHKKADCSTTNCTTNGDLQNSFKNYMSYCGSRIRFTQGQKDRVRTFLYSDNFWSLVLSDGLIPISTAFEVGIASIENNLDEPICNNFIPKIKIKNSGTTTITNLKIATYVDGAIYNTKTISTNLLRNAINTFNLNAIVFNSAGQHNLKFVITEMNSSTTDFQELNNQICKDILVRNNPVNTICLNLEDNNINTVLFSLDTIYKPKLTNISGCTQIGTKVLKYNTNSTLNPNKAFYLPHFNLDSVYSAYLVFNHAYKLDKVSSKLWFGIWGIDGCDSSAKFIYSFNNSQLASISGRDSINNWLPTNCAAWKTDSVNLNFFIGKNNLLLKCAAWNYGYVGNQPLYLDNFCIHKRYAIYARPSLSGGINIDYSHGYQIYDEGDTITITASSDEWSCKQFINWTENGVIVSTNPTYHITANKNRDLVANFIIPNFTITTNINPTNSGTISGNNGPYTCSSTANLIATPNTCYSFVNWTNQNGDTIATWDNTNFPMYENLNLTANFEKTRFYTYASITSTDTFPYGTGTINGASWYSNYLTCDDTAKLIATPGYCSEFAYWEERDGNGNTIILSNQPILSFIPNRIRNNINAVFRGITNSKLTLTSNIQNAGILTGAGTYSCGNIKQISAQSNSCYNFKYWMENGTLLSSSSNYNITLNTNRNILAVFEPKRYNITLVANPTNGGTVSNAGNFACDSMLTVKAKIKTGYKFTNWTEGSTIVSTDSNYTFLVSGARNLKANFSLVTGIKQSTINEISKVYPNPAKDILQVEIRSKQNTSLTLNIIDMKGSLLETKTITNTKGTFNTSFDVSKLSKGNYILNLYDEEGTASYKFVVQ